MTIGEFLEYAEIMFTAFRLPAVCLREPWTCNRILGTTALVEGLTWITADRNILASKAVEAL
jgi:hypothetical protein